jgi:hypothetical protein
LAQGNIRGIYEPKRMKKQDTEILRKAVIVRFTKGFMVIKSREIKIHAKF